MKQQDAQMDDAHADEAPRGDPHFCATEGCKGLAAMTYRGRPLCRECWEAQCGELENGKSVEGPGDACRPTEEQEPSEQENAMSKKKFTKTKATKKSAKGGTRVQPVATKRPTKAKVDAKAAPKAKKATEKKPKRVSALDAAAQVLKAAGKPMNSQELITAMAEKGLWSSPNGKTPSATIFAGILREISANGKAARFAKVDRGMFAFNASSDNA